MILHDDVVAFVRQLIDEQSAGVTLGDAVDLIAHRERLDQIAIAAGLQSPDAVLEGLAALQVDLPESTRLSDLLDLSQKQQASKQIPGVADEEVRVHRVRTWRRQFSGDEIVQWEKVHQGLSLELASLIVALLTGLVWIGILIGVDVLARARQSTADTQPTDTRALDGLSCGVGFFVALAMLCALAGQALCCAAPRQSAARGFAGLSLLCILLGPATGLWLNIMTNAPEKQQQVAFVWPAFAAFAGPMLGHVFFVVALCVMGSRLREPGTILLAAGHLVIGGFFGVSILLGVLQRPVANPSAPTQVISLPTSGELTFVVLFLVSGFAGFLMFLGLVKKTRDAVARAIGDT